MLKRILRTIVSAFWFILAVAELVDTAWCSLYNGSKDRRILLWLESLIPRGSVYLAPCSYRDGDHTTVKCAPGGEMKWVAGYNEPHGMFHPIIP